jgi:hypothetical protein
MPMIGAAGGAWAIAVASEKPGVDRVKVALTGAGIGVVVAGASTGWVRQLAGGAAAAGFALALIEYLRERAAAKSTAVSATAPPEPAKPVPSEPAGATDALTPEKWAHLQTIAAQLDAEEREQLHELEKKAPADLMLKVKRALVSMSVDDAVASLREKLFAKPYSRARNGTHASAVGS